MQEGIHDVQSELLQGNSAWAAVCLQISKKNMKKLCMWTKSVLEPGYIPHNIVSLHRNSGVLNVLMQQQKSHKVFLLTRITFSVI